MLIKSHPQTVPGATLFFQLHCYWPLCFISLLTHSPGLRTISTPVGWLSLQYCYNITFWNPLMKRTHGNGWASFSSLLSDACVFPDFGWEGCVASWTGMVTHSAERQREHREGIHGAPGLAPLADTRVPAQVLGELQDLLEEPQPLPLTTFLPLPWCTLTMHTHGIASVLTSTEDFY